MWILSTVLRAKSIDWCGTLGDGLVGMRNMIRRLSRRKRLLKLCGLIYSKVKKEYSQGATMDRSRSTIKGYNLPSYKAWTNREVNDSWITWSIKQSIIGDMEAGWRSESSKSSKFWNFGSGSDSTVDARSNTRDIDHDISWVCFAWLGERIIDVNHKHERPATEWSATERSTTELSTMDQSTMEQSNMDQSTLVRSATRLSAADNVMQEVNYIDMEYSTVVLSKS